MTLSRFCMIILAVGSLQTNAHATWWDDAKARWSPPNSGVTDLSTGSRDWGFHADFGAGSHAVPNVHYAPLRTNWEPPSIQAGCGGIRYNLGSFDVLASADVSEMVERIPEQALYYAIGLAMDALSPPAKNMIDYIQDKLNMFNLDSLNSCMAAQELVDTTVAAARRLGSQRQAEQTGDATHTPDRALSDDVIQTLVADLSGNWTFRVLDNTYSPSSMSNDEFYELLRLAHAFVGTWIVEIITDTSGGIDLGDFEMKQASIPRADITLNDIVNGFSDVPFMYCPSPPSRRNPGNPGGRRIDAAEQCLELQDDTMSWNSFADDIIQAYTEGSDSLIRVMRSPAQASHTLTSEQSRALNLIEPSLRRMIEDLVVGSGPNDSRLVEAFIVEAAEQVAIESAYTMMRNILQAMEVAVTETQFNMASRQADASQPESTERAESTNVEVLLQMLLRIRGIRNTLEAQHTDLTSDSNIADLIQRHQTILDRADRQRQFIVQNSRTR